MSAAKATSGPNGVAELGGRLFQTLVRLVPQAAQTRGEPVRAVRRIAAKPSSLLTITRVGSDQGCMVQIKHQYLLKGARRESLHVLDVDAEARSVAPRSVQRPDGTAFDFRKPGVKDGQAQALKLSLTLVEHLLAEGWGDAPDEPLAAV